jgi:hypothetical protein
MRPRNVKVFLLFINTSMPENLNQCAAEFCNKIVLNPSHQVVMLCPIEHLPSGLNLVPGGLVHRIALSLLAPPSG